MFALGPGTTLQHADGLISALEAICSKHGQQQNVQAGQAASHAAELLALGVSCMQQEPDMAITPREAAFSPTRRYMQQAKSLMPCVPALTAFA